MMERNGGLDPDIGYWAADADPTGVLHPLHYTYRMGDKWVNVTTVPDAVRRVPAVPGRRRPRGAAAPDARRVARARSRPRALARRIGGGDGWPAFWIIGLASPVAVYALDFWEHTLGLGLMLWGVVLLLDVLDRRGRMARGARRRVRCSAPRRPCAPRRSSTSSSRPGLSVSAMPWCATDVWARPVGIGLLTLARRRRAARCQPAARAADHRHRRARHPSGRDRVGRGNLGWADRVREALTTAVGTGILGSDVRQARSIVGVVAVACGRGRRLVPHQHRTATHRPRRRRSSPSVRSSTSCASGRAGGSSPACSSRPRSRRSGCAWRGRVRSCASPRRSRAPRSRSPGTRSTRAVPTRSGAGGTSSRRARCSRSPAASRSVTTRRAFVRGRHPRRGHDPRGGRLAVGPFAHGGRRDGDDRRPPRRDLISRQTHLLREGGAFYDADEHWLTATTDAQLRHAVGIAGGPGPGVRPGRRQRGDAAGVARRIRAWAHRAGAFIRPDVKVAVTTYRLP